MSHLLVLNGEHRGQTFEIGQELTVGRSSSATIRVGGSQVSRDHARIVRTGNHFVVEDLESRNGIFVNGEKVDSQPLEAGDEIQVGGVILVYEPPFDLRVTPMGEGRSVVVRKSGHEHESLVTADTGELLAEGIPDIEVLAASMDPTAILGAHRRLHAVYEVGSAINRILEFDDLVNRVVELVLDHLRGDRCILLLSRGKGLEDLKPAGMATTADEPDQHVSISSTVLGLAWGEGKAILSDDVQHDIRFDGSESLKFDAIRSLVCAPLEVHQKRLGVLYVDVREAKTRYDSEDLRLLVTIANQVAGAIENARRYTASVRKNQALREHLRDESRMVGKSPQIENIFGQVEKVAPSEVTVLLRGETGTGKELVALAVHDLSSRRAGPFVAVNCAAMAESLLESELFGHEKGAFTGAVNDKPGKFELADGGTLFLDEVGEMTPTLQTKLLRAIEEKVFDRVGGTWPISVDVRIISATNRNLEEEIRKGAFREDLFYRLCVVPIDLPALRDREGDVPVLAVHFLERFNAAMNRNLRGFDSEAMKTLCAYRWPGNVRELRNLIERIVVLSEKDWIGVEELPPDMTGQELQLGIQERINAGNLALPEIVAQAEKLCIELALREARGKKVEAAKILKISRPTLDKKIRDYSIVVIK